MSNLRVSEDEKVGVRIVQKALEEPLRWIADNAGADGSVVLDKVKNGKGAFGFNAAAEEFEDLVKAGIVDPTKVVRTALTSAVDRIQDTPQTIGGSAIDIVDRPSYGRDLLE